ncbi:hypothetical protein Q9L58_004603 [Maublancomyces gigas]|uniref:Uncharacterized protein n=1 Tax=Discina gigas TaxID=1032678 RepID=A0ABR3GKJ4_9PEZI
MQYSTLRISALVAVFSASTALAYLDCGGGRAPPKTTVPGCPGYVGPTSGVIATSIIVSSTSSAIASPTDSVTESPSDEDLISALFDESIGVDDGLCVCSGYFCEFARPGCVSIDKNGVRSTIVANPGYQTKAFVSSAYSSYTATAGPVMYYSIDGAMISSKPTATGHLSGSVSSASSSSSSTSHSHTATGTIVSAVTATGNSSSTITQAPTTMDTSTVSSVANATMSSNTTAPASGLPLTAPSSGASKVSGLSSLAIFLGLGMGAMALL